MDDIEVVAKTAGTSVAKAKQVVETGKSLLDCDAVSGALASGSVSFDQASEIVKAEKAAPGTSEDLLKVAASESFHVLRERSRKVVLEAGQHRGLGERQREARTARHFTDELGMRNIHLRLPPTLGEAICNRAETEAQRLHRQARRENRAEPYERHLADAFAKMLAGKLGEAPLQASRAGRAGEPRGRPAGLGRRAARRGVQDPRRRSGGASGGARQVAPDAFLTGLVYDGHDLRQIMSWTRNWPVEVRRALNLGEPPEFDGLKCVDCGNRFHIEDDHLEPYLGGEIRAPTGTTSIAAGPATRPRPRPTARPGS